MSALHEDDFDLAAYADRFAAAIDAEEIQVPGPGTEPGRGCWFSLAGTDDPAATQLDGFTQHGPLDEREPDAVLAAMTETAAADPATLRSLSDNALLGLVGAGQRMAGRAAAIQQRAIAEYARRQRQPVKAKAGKAGYTLFAQDDLAPELVLNSNQAEVAMIRCEAAEARLPKCSQLLWNGGLSEYRMRIITDQAMCLDDAGAAEADQIIASAAAGLTPGQLRALAARVVMMVDPAAAQARRKDAVKNARVEKFRELSGTAALCGRDLPAQSVLRSWSHIESQAKALKAIGVCATIAQLRVAVYLGLTSGLDPLAILPEILAGADPRDWDNGPAGGTASSGPGSSRTGDGWPWDQPDEAENQPDGEAPEVGEEPDSPADGEDGEGPAGGSRGPRRPPGPPDPGGGVVGTDAPVPATINLQVPAGTMFAWSSAPGDIPGYGPVDPEDLRDLVQAASTHPGTRWCVTIIDPGTGEAVAHGCASGQHRWNPNLYRTGGGDRDGPFPAPERSTAPGPDDLRQAAAEFIASLRVKLAPIAKGTCQHAHRTDRYVIPRRLQHLVKARKTTCIAPGCNRPAADGDADHTIAWPQGDSCECNLGAPCRYHHRNKQADQWELTQPEPGVFRWKAPSGRVRTTTPSTYLI
jgi:hypothetical protein